MDLNKPHFKIGQGLILHESLNRADCDWYKPGIFYLKYRYQSGTIKAKKEDYHKTYVNSDGTYNNELVECFSLKGESLLVTENKFILAPLNEVRDDKLNVLLDINITI